MVTFRLVQALDYISTQPHIIRTSFAVALSTCTSTENHHASRKLVTAADWSSRFSSVMQVSYGRLSSPKRYVGHQPGAAVDFLAVLALISKAPFEPQRLLPMITYSLKQQRLQPHQNLPLKLSAYLST